MTRHRKLGRGVAVVGAGMSRFGTFPEKATRDLFVEAFQLPPVVFATLGMAAIVGLPVTIVLYGRVLARLVPSEPREAGAILGLHAFDWLVVPVLVAAPLLAVELFETLVRWSTQPGFENRRSRSKSSSTRTA